MALEPVNPLAAAALRLDTEGAATLERLVVGDSVAARVVALLRNGGVRLALLDPLFSGAPHQATEAARAGVARSESAGRLPAPATPSDRSPPAQPANAGAPNRPAAPDGAAPSLAARPTPAREPARPTFVDLPQASGLKVGDAVRITVIDVAPHLSVRVRPIPDGAAPAIVGADEVDVADAAMRAPTAGPRLPADPLARNPAAPVGIEPRAPIAAMPRDAVTLSPEAALSLLLEDDGVGITGTATPLRLERPVLRPEARAALSTMIPKAAAGQASLAPLVAEARAVVEAPVFRHLPEPVRQAVQRLVEAIGVDPATLDGPTLRRAIEAAGPFFEARLVATPMPAATPSTPVASLAMQADAKNLLLLLRSALSAFLGEETPAPPDGERPPPPRRGAPPRGQPAAPLPPQMPDEPLAVAKRLAGAVEGALDRIRLQQAAALPDEPHEPTRPEPGTPDRLVEIPLRLGPADNPVLALTVGPDGRPSVPGQPRGFRLQLSLDLGDAGRVDGTVGVRGRTTSVMLHASNPDTMARLREALPMLHDALMLADLEIDWIDLRDKPAPEPPPPRAGTFLDRSS